MLHAADPLTPRLDPPTLLHVPRSPVGPPPCGAEPSEALAPLGRPQRHPPSALHDEGALGEGGWVWRPDVWRRGARTSRRADR